MIHPNEIERYSLRLLLLHVKGASCFEDIRTYEGVVYETYHEAAVQRKLMVDDKEWDNCLLEASIKITSSIMLRQLFISILCYSEPSQPKKLWLNHRNTLCQDILYNQRKGLGDQSIQFSEDIYNNGLYELDILLRNNGKTLKAYTNMTQLPINFIPFTTTSQLRTNKSQHEIDALKIIVSINEGKLNAGQKMIYNKIIDQLKTPSKRIHFIDGPGVCNFLNFLLIMFLDTILKKNIMLNREQAKLFCTIPYWLE